MEKCGYRSVTACSIRGCFCSIDVNLTTPVSPILVGALAAAEPLGSIAVGIALSAGWLRLNGSRALLRGSLLFLIGLMAMAFSPWFLLAFVLLLIGGFGTAAFSNMQTALILTQAPLATRSRVMGS
jgi:MFS family permease